VIWKTEQWFFAAREAVDTIPATGANNNILIPRKMLILGLIHGTNHIMVRQMLRRLFRYFSSKEKRILYLRFINTLILINSGTCALLNALDLPSDKLFVNWVNWLNKNNLKGFVGELGGAVNRGCKACIWRSHFLLKKKKKNSSHIVGWTWWAAGPWWG